MQASLGKDTAENKDEKQDAVEGNTDFCKALDILKSKDKKRLKTAVAILKTREEPRSGYKQAVILFGKWLDDLQGDSPEFITVAKALINWHRGYELASTEPEMELLHLAIHLTQREDALADCDDYYTEKPIQTGDHDIRS